MIQSCYHSDAVADEGYRSVLLLSRGKLEFLDALLQVGDCLLRASSVHNAKRAAQLFHAAVHTPVIDFALRAQDETAHQGKLDLNLDLNLGIAFFTSEEGFHARKLSLRRRRHAIQSCMLHFSSSIVFRNAS